MAIRFSRWQSANRKQAIIPLSGGSRAEGLLHYASRAMGLGGITNHDNRDSNVNFTTKITINGNADDKVPEAIESRLRKMIHTV